MKKDGVKSVNIIAKDLHTPKYRLRVVKNKKRYNRKKNKNSHED